MKKAATANEAMDAGIASGAKLRPETGRVDKREPHRQEAPRDLREGTSSAYVWYVLGLLTVVNVFSYMDRTALSVLLPSIKRELTLSDGQLGLLIGFAFFLFYAMCGIPVARWADRGNRSTVISITLAVWSVMAMLNGAAQNFWHLLVARIGLGAGEAGCIPAGQSIISDYVPLKRRASAYAITTFGMSAGTMLGLVLAGWLGDLIGWRWTFVALGIPGIAFALVVKLTLREPVRGASDGVPDDRARASLRETLAALWACHSYRRIVVFFILSGFANAGLSTWWPSFYARIFEISLSSVGIGLGLAIGAGSALGTIIGGAIAHKAARRSVSLPLIIGSAAICLALPAALAALFVPSASVSMMLALLTFLLWSVPSGPITAAIYSVTRPRMRATASALTIFVMSVLGFGLGPLCVGLLSDALTPWLGVRALRYALLLPTCGLAGAAVALFTVSRSLPADLRAAGVRIV